jgi:uncharacterized membrane protein YebE (DUF533 family)
MFDAKKLLDMMMGAGQQGGANTTPASGGVGGLLGSVLSKAGGVLGQATQGVKDSAQAIDQRTGASTKADGLVRSASGGSGIGDLLTKAKGMMGQNQLATGAALGGLAGLLLGTKTGRGIAGGAAKMGALALVGGLAYKAYQNYSSGKPVLGGPVEEAPAASPYGTTGNEEHDNATAILMIRAMIAAAASDGLIDNEERSRIIGGLEHAGLDVAAAKFLDTEFAQPASVSDLVKAATTPELKQEVYTAARIAIDPDTAQEKAFLAALSQQLGLEQGFVDHIEAAALQAKAAGPV